MIGAFFLAFCFCPALAASGLPDHAFRSSQLSRAVEQARRQDKALAFLLTDEHTSCQLCRDASQDAVSTLSHHAVLVFVDRESVNGLPGRVRRALSSAQAGQLMPKVVVTDIRMRRIIAIVPFARQPRRRQLLTRAVQQMERHSRARSNKQTRLAKRGRQPVQRVRPGSKAVHPTAVDAPAVRSPKRAQSHRLRAPRLRPVVILRWKGDLLPAPADLMGGYFQDQGIPMRGRCRDASCRFEVTDPMTTEVFMTDLQIFLNRHFRVDRIHTREGQVTAWLAALEQGDPPSPDPSDGPVQDESARP